MATSVQVCARHPGLVAHRFARGSLWASRGRRLLARDDGGPFRPVGRVAVLSGASTERLPWVAQAARWGVHGLLALESGVLLAAIRGRLLRRTPGQGWQRAMRWSGWHKPARGGLELDSRGRVWLAQYAGNSDRRSAMRLWRSDDDGLSFVPVHTFAAGRVRHLHFVAEDPFDRSIWIGTGDRDRECGLYRSPDGDAPLERIGGGDQRWRAAALAFSPDAITWGTDAGRDAPDYPNRVVRLDRVSRRLELGRPLPGPVHSATTTTAGDILLATGVEGGAGRRSRRVQLWRGRDGAAFSPIIDFAAGLQPRRVQYAVAHFVPGQPDRPSEAPLVVVLRGVAGMALGSVELELAPG